MNYGLCFCFIFYTEYYIAGAFNSTKNSGTFETGDECYGNFLGKFPENPQIVKFPKCQPFNQKFRDGINGTEIPGKKFSEIWV